LFSDEEVKDEYTKYEKMLNVNRILDIKGKTLIYDPSLEDFKHEPDIIHMLKGITQTENKIFDHDFKIKA
jgi:hypothetical protein